MGTFTLITAQARKTEEQIAMKENLIADASSRMSDWITDLQLGIISDVDKTSLIAWREYVKSLQAIDPSATEDITWPSQPA